MAPNPEPATILAGLRADINALKDTFERWCKEVYERGLLNQKETRSAAKEERGEDIRSEAARWTANELSHQEIIKRLDLLNGWRNKVMGISQLLLFCAPLAVAIWAIVTRG